MPKSIYEAAGGKQAFEDLAHAWHARCLADPVVSHAFSHGYHPQHSERLAAYWAEALGGPPDYTTSIADESSVVRLHAGNGEHQEMDERAQDCFARALDDAGLPDDPRLRAALKAYFRWATTTMSAYPGSADDVPVGLALAQWSWDGPVVTPIAAPGGEPVTPLPAAKAFGEDERSVLLGYLTYHRTVLARKIEGLTDEQARRAACPPSGLTLLGLIRHMTDVERWWFRRVLQAEAIPGLFADEEEWRLPADATVADALAAYWGEIAVVDRHLATATMDDRNEGEPDRGQHALRRTIVHMIEEYARHCGHADLLREVIDGTTGD